jgi:DNA-binding CsgD family transcriptional regulator/tetratricopeptide (TPR) repeat protein
MIGRGGERTVLAEALADVADGRGRSVLIEGEPGIGKSALAAAVLGTLERNGDQNTHIEVLRGGCDELGRRFPLSVLVAALGVAEGAADPDRARAARALAKREPTAARQPAVASGDGATAAIESLAELVDRLCARSPVLLAVDDLQWADDASLQLWTQLSRATAQLPLLLIGLCRPSPRPTGLAELRAELAAAKHGTVLTLDPLGKEEVAQLAARLAGGEPGPAFGTMLESAAGNPLYVREIVDALGRSGQLRATDGAVELVATEPGDPSVASLAGAIADRLEFLSPQCRNVLQAAALQGVEVTAEQVSALAGLPVAEVEPMLLEAIETGVVEQIGPAVRFRHGLIRQALFESMPEALRIAMYRDAALQLIRSGAAVERTAEAVLRALDAADGWELDWLVDNAESLAYLAPSIAVELFEHALAHTGGAVDARAEHLEDQLAAVLFLTGRYEEAEQLARDILAAADAAEPERHGYASWILAQVLLRVARYDDALTFVTEASKTLSPLWAARLSVVRAMVFNRTAEPADARAAAEEALRLGEELNDPLTIGYALHPLSLRSVTEGDQVGALARMDRALDVIEGDARLDDLRTLILTNRATVLDILDRQEESLASLRRAAAISERTGTTRINLLRLHIGTASFNRGEWDDALVELGAIDDLESFVDVPVLYHGMCALIAVHRDDADALTGELRALDEAGDVDWAASLLPGIAARALEAERAGRLGDAAEILRVLVDPDQPRFHEARADFLPYLVRAALSAGDIELAREAADAAKEEYELEPIAYKEAMYGWCRGQIDQDPAPVLAAADYFRVAHRPMELGNALEDAAELQAVQGDIEGARTELAAALAVYTGLDASWPGQRAAARLRRYGVRLGVRGPRQRPRHGWAALTDTELRVAELAATGMSNPDIAARLLLSRRTVQTHVSHILGKLGAQSRREIARFATEH